MDLSSTSGKQAAMQSARTRSRASAVGQFRSSLATEKAANLRAVVNEAGGMKNFFIDGDTFSEPRSDTADNIARNFLGRHNSLFALPGASTEELILENEDNDQGTTFLNYTQTVHGLKVWEGQVQVVVNKNGEVLNVREGFLVDGPPLKRKGAMNEAKASRKRSSMRAEMCFRLLWRSILERQPDSLVHIPPDYKSIEHDRWIKLENAIVTYKPKPAKDATVFRSPGGHLFIRVNDWTYLVRPAEATVETAFRELLVTRTGQFVWETQDTEAYSSISYKDPRPPSKWENRENKKVTIAPNSVTFRATDYERSKAIIQVRW